MIFNSGYCLKWRGYFAWSMILLAGLAAESCQSKSSASSQEPDTDTAPDTLPADFVKFFSRFHDDSAYQMEHIIFPLEGLPATTGVDDTIIPARYYWQKADWKKHNRFTDPGRNFEHWFEVHDARLIEHWIQMNGTNLYMRRRFAHFDDGWYLIYYQGMRPMNIEKEE